MKSFINSKTMKQTKLFKTLLLLTMLLLASPKLQAQEPYAVLSEDDTTLTFYYDNNKESRNGMDIGPFEYDMSIMGPNSGWYAQSKSITTVVFDDSFADCTSVTSTSFWFEGCNNLTTIIGISNLHTDNVTDMSWMFEYCTSLTNLDVTSFNTQNVTNMDGMFCNCSSLTSIDLSYFNTQSVTRTYYMFYFSYSSSLKKIYVGKSWTMEKVTNGGAMFSGCTQLTGGAGTTYDASHTDYTYAHIDGGTENPGYLTYKDSEDAREPYAVLSEDNTTLTFYYDDSKESRNGMDVGPFTYSNGVNSGWYAQRKSITTVVFDDNFANCTSITSTAYWFVECNNLTTITGIGNLRTDNVTDMREMFYYCSNLTNLDVSHFNTQNVTNMTGMFNNCSSLTSLDVTNFNTQNVTNMTGMFYNCNSLTSLDVTKFDTKNVTGMATMFSSCNSLTSLDLTNFDTQNVTKMNDMFRYCSSLTSLDVTNFNTRNVSHMDWMFAGCRSLTSLDVTNFNTQNVIYMNSMFAGCISLTSLDLSNFNTQHVINMDDMFWDCNSLTSLDLSNFITRNVNDMSGMFRNCSGLTRLDISSFYTRNLTQTSNMFSGCSSLAKIYVGKKWSMQKVTNGNNMFSGCTQLTGGAGTTYEASHTDYTYAHVDGGLDNPGYLTYKEPEDAREPYAVLSEDNTTLTFYYDEKMDNRNGMDVGPFAFTWGDSYPDWKEHSSSITTVIFDDSFADCTTISSTAYWFGSCNNLTTITGIGNLHTDNVTNMRSMFYGCSSLTSIDVTNFNTQNVTDMGCMFWDCSSLTSLDLTNFNTQNVTDMSYMFYGCSSLTSLDVSHFNTQYVTEMSCMFSNCHSLTNLNLSNFDTQKVTAMSRMFSYCRSLTNLDISNFNTQNVTDMAEMFYDCYSLTSLDVTNFNTQNVTDMNYMFNNCCSLTSLDVTNFNTQNVNNMSGIFYGCESLTSLDVTSFDTQNGPDTYYMFGSCSSLEIVMIGENMSVIKSCAFDYCPELTDVYCLAVTVPNADSDAFDKDYIEVNTTLHVPAVSISDYQTTVPWCYFKNIVALDEAKTDLVDGETYDNESVVNNVNISYTRTFNNTNWQALYVPFAMSYDDWKDDFDVTEINNFHEYDDNEDGKVDRTVLEILYVKEGSTLPNTPYLIRAKETGTKVISLVNTTLYAAEENSIDCSSVRTKYTFTGTYTGVSGEEMYDNGYYALAGGTLSQPSSANVSLGSFRWYLKPESRTGNYAAPRKISVRVIGEADGETTSIAEATMNDRQEEYYNLEGVRINRAEATGVYIVRYADGRMKKVIKK